ncbi:MAG: hypothetical protein KGH79_04275 [Patescibacteria group bacterium]|nr:hypothetical protein [Patescibacteria group bacterium]
MKYIRTILAALAATGLLLLAAPPAANALVSYPPGSLLQPNDVATTTIRDYSITPSKLATGSDFTVHGITSTNATSTNATTTTLVVSGSTLSLNGVTYTTPSADGSNGQSLTTNGSKVLSWSAPASSKLYIPLKAGYATTKGDAVFSTNDIISIEASSTNEAGAGNATASTSVTSTGPNRLVLIFADDQSGTPITGVPTVNGSNATFIASTSNAAIATYAWYYTNPTSGNDSVVLTRPSTTSSLDMDVLALNNAKQSGQPDQKTTNTCSSCTSITDTLTTVADFSRQFMIFGNGGGTVTAGTNSTVQYTQSNNGHTYASSVAAQHPAGSASMALSFPSTNPSTVMVSIAPTGETLLEPTSAKTASTTAGFMGFVESAVSSGTVANVDVSGDASLFSGLIPGFVYYLNNANGSIGTSAGTNTRKVGIAASSTDLIITNEP